MNGNVRAVFLSCPLGTNLLNPQYVASHGYVQQTTDHHNASDGQGLLLIHSK